MSATTRSLDDARSKHELMGKYIAECERIDAFKVKFNVPEDINCVIADDFYDWSITVGERLEVFERRRERLLKDLENKGIRIQPESESLPSIARAIEQQNA